MCCAHDAAACYPSLLNTVTSDPDIADFLILLSRFGAQTRWTATCARVLGSFDSAHVHAIKSYVQQEWFLVIRPGFVPQG